MDTAHCHCYSPQKKMATSIKSLMVPESAMVVSKRGTKMSELGSDAEKRKNYGVSDGEEKKQGKTGKGKMR